MSRWTSSFTQCNFFSTRFRRSKPLHRRHAEQNLHGQERLDCGIAVGLLATTPAGLRGIPAYLGIEPGRRRTPALDRFIVGRPVPGLVGRRCGSAHANQLPRWTFVMNSPQDLCNKTIGLRTQRPCRTVHHAQIHNTDISDNAQPGDCIVCAVSDHPAEASADRVKGWASPQKLHYLGGTNAN